MSAAVLSLLLNQRLNQQNYQSQNSGSDWSLFDAIKIAGLGYVLYWLYQQYIKIRDAGKKAEEDVAAALKSAGDYIAQQANIVGQELDKAFNAKIPDKKPCPDGMRDDGTSCWADTYGNGVGTIPKCDNIGNWFAGKCTRCPEGQTNIAGLCYNNCKDGFEFVGGNLCQPKGGPGIRVTPFDRYVCPPSSDPSATNLVGALCQRP